MLLKFFFLLLFLQFELVFGFSALGLVREICLKMQLGFQTLFSLQLIRFISLSLWQTHTYSHTHKHKHILSFTSISFHFDDEVIYCRKQMWEYSSQSEVVTEKIEPNLNMAYNSSEWILFHSFSILSYWTLFALTKTLHQFAKLHQTVAVQLLTVSNTKHNIIFFRKSLHERKILIESGDTSEVHWTPF